MRRPARQSGSRAPRLYHDLPPPRVDATRWQNVKGVACQVGFGTWAGAWQAAAWAFRCNGPGGVRWDVVLCGLRWRRAHELEEELTDGDYCTVALDDEPDQWALVSPDANKKLRDTALAAFRWHDTCVRHVARWSHISCRSWVLP